MYTILYRNSLPYISSHITEKDANGTEYHQTLHNIEVPFEINKDIAALTPSVQTQLNSLKIPETSPFIDERRK